MRSSRLLRVRRPSRVFLFARSRVIDNDVLRTAVVLSPVEMLFSPKRRVSAQKSKMV